MCEFFSCLITKQGKCVWDRNTASHEELVAKAGLADGKLKDREFVRCELTPEKPMDFFSPASEWTFKVDEEGTLPKWFNERRAEQAARKAVGECLKPLNLKEVKRFIDSIPRVKFYSMNTPVKKEWVHSTGENWVAAGNAARDAAWNAAGNAAGDAAWNTAWNAAWNAARDAAGNAAGNAARDAAWNAARDAAGNAAGNAGLLARCLLAKDKLGAKHLKHARARWAVWKRGYGLRCDVNGKLYTYGLNKKPVPRKKEKETKKNSGSSGLGNQRVSKEEARGA